MENARVLVTGAGGFIGHHLVKYLKEKGCWVRGVDIKEPEYEQTAADEFELLDLRRSERHWCKVILRHTAISGSMNRKFNAK